MAIVRLYRAPLQQFQPGMLFEVCGDLAGVANAVVIADHHDHQLPLVRTCGSGFRWVSSSASTIARRGSPASRATDPAVRGGGPRRLPADDSAVP